MRRRELLARAAEGEGLVFPHRCDPNGVCEHRQAGPSYITIWPEGGGWCSFETRRFLIGGKLVPVTIPDCVIWGMGTRRWLDLVGELLGLQFVHKHEVERLLRMRGAHCTAHWELDNFPFVYEAAFGHRWYSMRDVAHLFPHALRCDCCRKKLRFPDSRLERWNSKADNPHPGIRGRMEHFCSQECMRTQNRRMRLEELKKERELKWVKKGSVLLKEFRQLTKNPEKLRAASQSRSVASTRDGSSPP